MVYFTVITSENGGKEETLDQVYEVEQMECPNATVLDIETVSESFLSFNLEYSHTILFISF